MLSPPLRPAPAPLNDSNRHDLKHSQILLPAIDARTHSDPWNLHISAMDTCKCDQTYTLVGLENQPAQVLSHVEDFVSLLETCRESKDGALAKVTHVRLCESGLDTQIVFANRLIDMFAKCRRMAEAQRVFNKLVYRFDSSWDILIQGYSEYGDLQHAFNLFKTMQKECSHLHRPSFLALLRACARMMCIEKGQELFNEVAIDGLENDPFISTTVLDMYAKCGSLAEAQEVFDELPFRDVVLWTTLISAYSEHGHLEEVLNCLERMQSEGLFPDTVTFICSLKSCGSLMVLERGCILHIAIVKLGLDSGSLVGNTLVQMYAKCGALDEADHVFNQLPVRDVFSWSSLLHGYAEHGHADKSLTCLDRMQSDGIIPNIVTYVCSLKACACMGVAHHGQKVHAWVVQDGYENDTSVGNSLVAMYAKCGLLEEAWMVFNELPIRDIISWNSLIAGYIDHGLAEEVLRCLEQMHIERVLPDETTFVSSLKACGCVGIVQQALELHTRIVREGREQDVRVGSALVDTYASCGSLAEAQKVFDVLAVPDVVSWNTLMSGFNGHGLHREVLTCFNQMQIQGMPMDAVSLVCGLQACSAMGAVEKLRKIHEKIIREGYESDLVVNNCLVDTYVKCGLVAEAEKVFEVMMSSRDIISWTAIIFGCAEQGESAKAFLFYAQMQEQGLLPNHVSVLSILKACGNATALRNGREVHARIFFQLGKHADDGISMETSLVDMYAMCGSMNDAEQVFDAMEMRDYLCWTSLITGYAREGKTLYVLHLFERMRNEGFHPNEITFLSVLSACSHVGLVDDGRLYFEAMNKEYNIIPSIKHVSCMVDLFCRAGQLTEAILMLESMSFQADIVIWKTVLAACKKWGDVVLGRRAFEGAISVDKEHNAAFFLMSSIYADAQMWEEVQFIDTMRKKNQSCA